LEHLQRQQLETSNSISCVDAGTQTGSKRGWSRINRELSDVGPHDGGHVAAAGEALGAWRSWCARRDAGLRDARRAEAVAAGHIDVQILQGQALHADAAGEGPGAVGLGRKLQAVAGGLLLELLGDEPELCVLGARRGLKQNPKLKDIQKLDY